MHLGRLFSLGWSTQYLPTSQLRFKVDVGVLAELNRLTSKMPMPKAGLTSKNNAALRQFDDPAVLQRLIALPDRLWAEVKRG